MERNEQEMISFKTELALENCLQKTVIDRLHNEKIKKITERKKKAKFGTNHSQKMKNFFTWNRHGSRK